MNSLSEFEPAFMTLEERSPVVVVHLSRPDLSEEANIEELGREFSTLVDHFGCRLLAVNMQDVKVVTSSALGKLISLHRKLHRSAGRLVVCGVQGMVKDSMEISRLSDYFTMAPTTDDAVALLNEPSA